MTHEERLFYLRNQYADELLTEDELQELYAAIPHPEHDEEIQRLRRLKMEMRVLQQEVAPRPGLWAGIAQAIVPAQSSPVGMTPRVRTGAPVWRKVGLAWTAVAAAVALVMFLLYTPEQPTGTGWSVTSADGDIYLGTEAADAQTELPFGEYVRTGNGATAVISGKAVGTITLDENSELALIRADTGQHRLKLRRGTMHAVVTTPPRFFYVETPSATAIDLGCAYTLATDERGNGKLEVAAGYVAFRKPRHTAIVPSGYACRMYQRTGPGTPFSARATNDFIAALHRYDNEGDTSAVYAAVEHAQKADALSLWHLMWEAGGELKSYLFESLQLFAPLPKGVDRAAILANSPPAYAEWGKEFGVQPWMIDVEEPETEVHVRLFERQ